MQTAAELGFPERQPQTLVEELDFLRRDRLTTTLAVTDFSASHSSLKLS
jgi:hypothetical protein